MSGIMRENDTVLDVCAEFRKTVYCARACNVGIKPEWIEDLTDRVEEAHKRECEMSIRELERLKDVCEGLARENGRLMAEKDNVADFKNMGLEDGINVYNNDGDGFSEVKINLCIRLQDEFGTKLDEKNVRRAVLDAIREQVMRARHV